MFELTSFQVSNRTNLCKLGIFGSSRTQCVTSSNKTGQMVLVSTNCLQFTLTDDCREATAMKGFRTSKELISQPQAQNCLESFSRLQAKTCPGHYPRTRINKTQWPHISRRNDMDTHNYKIHNSYEYTQEILREKALHQTHLQLNDVT